MKRTLWIFAATMAISVAPAPGSTVSAVLNRDGSVVAVTASGSATFISSLGFGGTGLTLDNDGNFIIVTGSSLWKVTPDGLGYFITAAASGSQFISVAVDGSSNYVVVADNQLHRILKISPRKGNLWVTTSVSEPSR